MSKVEIQYDEFLSSIGQKIPNTDVNLLVKIMYLERKLTDVSPKVDLHIEYKSNIDPMKKTRNDSCKIWISNSDKH